MKNTRKPGAGEGGRRPPRSGTGADGDKRRPDGGKPRAAGSRDERPRRFGPKTDAPRTGAPRGRPPAKDPAHIAVTGEGERISKIMARAGVASRRDCERMILEGRVTLNGKVLATPALNCTPADIIEVDGAPIAAIERTRLWIYYKPQGLVTTNHDPEGRPTVFDNLPEELPRVISVGRLDINTEGLLLLTNDGGLARMLELPTTGWLRRYRVRAYGAIDQARLDELKEGIAVDGVFYGAIEATLDREQGHNVWITMGLREGKNREIKNVLGALGLDVNRLIRISYGPFQLGELEDGEVVEVKSRTLRDQLGPRLIAEANANFEAPISTPAVKADVKEEDWIVRQPEQRRESRDDRRERDLARIDTRKPARGRDDDRKPRGDDRKPMRGRDEDRKARGERPDDKKKRPPLGTIRTANVWMAPGARPVDADKDATEITDRAGRKIARVRKPPAEAAAAPAKTRKPPARKPSKAAADRRGDAGREERTFEPRRGKPRDADTAGGGDRPRERAPRAGGFDGKPAAGRSARPRDENGPRGASSGENGLRRSGPGRDGPAKGGPGRGAPRSDGPNKSGPGAGGPRGGKGPRNGADRRR